MIQGGDAESVIAEQVPIDEIVPDPGGIGWEEWLGAGVALAVAIAIATGARRIIRKFAERSDTVTSTVQIVARILYGTVVAIGVYIALSILGINLAPLLAGAGILSLVIGFALKDVAENYVAGVLMGFNNPFSPGDQIVVDDGRLEGEVEELQLRYTVIRSTDGVRVLMPNALLIKNPLENLTVNGARRSHFTVGVAFDSDLDEVRRIAVEAVSDVDGVHTIPVPEAFVEELAGSWVTIRVRFWHGARNHDRWEVRGRAITAAFTALDSAGVDMPYRHRVVQVEGLGQLPAMRNDDHHDFVDDRSGDGSERER